MFVALSGNIGSGKSTWTLRLAAALDLPAFPEMPEANAWFGRGSHAALEELRFLISSAQDVAKLSHPGGPGGVLERVPAEHVRVFGYAKRELGLLSAEELELASDAYDLLASRLPGPQVLVRVHAPSDELLRRIRARGRHEEDGIDLGTLHRLQDRYDAFFADWGACPVVDLDTTRLHPDRPGDVAAARQGIVEATGMMPGSGGR